ncbi:MAG TPA: PilZ domain-containing protein [Candidatus Acidoferrum sp.]
MSTSTQQFSDAAQAHERRLHSRIFPKSLIYVACGQANGGMVLNAGEEGLAISMAIAVGDEVYSRLNVRMNGLAQPIEAQGRMVWTTRSKKRAGVQLLDISEAQRGQIREWLQLDGIRDINLTPRSEPYKSVTPPVAVPSAAVSSMALAEPVLTAPPLVPTHFLEPHMAEPRFVEPSSLLEVFGGTAPESLGPALSESFPAASKSAASLPSQSFDTVNPAGFRDNEWDLASVTMVPRKKPQSKGLSAVALILLWIAIPAFGIGVLAGRRPLERWLSGTETAGRRTTNEAATPSTKSGSLQEEPVLEPNEGIIEDSGTAVLAPSFVETPVVSKPSESGPTEAGDSRESRLLNSMSTQEARAFKNVKPVAPPPTAPSGDASQLAAEPKAPVLSSNPNAISTLELPKQTPVSKRATNPSPAASVNNSDAPRRDSKQVAASSNLEADRGFNNAQNSAQAISLSTGTNTVSNANSSGTPSNSRLGTYANPNPLYQNQNSAASNASSPAPRVAQPSPMADRYASVAAPRNYNNTTPGNYSNRNDAAGNYSNRSTAQGNYNNRNDAQATSRDSSTLSASNAAAPPLPRSSGPVAVASSPRAVPSSYVPSLAPVKAAPPLHGVMLIARRNDESFVLRLPEESIPGFNRSTVMRMQRFVMMPQQSRWHRHGAIAKVSIGDLLTHAAPEKPDARIQPRTGESITVRAYVDKNGSVEDLKPVSGRFALMPRVMRALRDWQFDQTLVDGKPVESEINVTVEFRPES